MKITTLAASLIVASLAYPAASASAAGKPGVCAKFFTCGTFTGTMTGTNSRGLPEDEHKETITIRSTGVNTGEITMAVSDKDGRNERRWVLEFTFRDDGHFTASVDGKPHISGFCGNSVCTYGMVPYDLGRGFTGTSGIFRFDGSKLERHMISLTPAESIHDISKLEKIN